MDFPITDILFYGFAAVLVAAALAVITARNPVHSVFFLIVAFFNASGLFVLLGAEYIAMTLVIVYVGAVAVLFLFVVMMLNINFEKFRAGFIKHLPLGFGVAALLFVEIGALLYQSLHTQAPVVVSPVPIPDVTQTTNAEAVGLLLYTHYASLFQLAGVILLVAMIGAIVLTLRQREGVRKQRIYTQNTRKKSDSIEIVKRQPGQGA
jgi:NADH-quinone oxidoreductase subunit J